jgi:hypothetical protein
MPVASVSFTSVVKFFSISLSILTIDGITSCFIKIPFLRLKTIRSNVQDNTEESLERSVEPLELARLLIALN